ncbi:hypothetical protein CI109_101596 [Kwoniella shandongensis]|uniref:DNA mismatch repair protein MutS core domain-containing protein n=1 Tax=Kwoniella shandongensis TaxID=1734106 RepID=A0AAJ8LDN0_9TREE
MHNEIMTASSYRSSAKDSARASGSALESERSLWRASASRQPASSRTNTASRYGQQPAQPSTYISNRIGDNGQYYVALLQGKGEGVEVGIAAINVATGHVADTPSYSKTLHHLHLHPPQMLLVPEGELWPKAAYGAYRGRGGRKEASALVTKLEEELEQECVGVERALWNPEQGLEFLKQLGINDDTKASTLMAVQSKQYALCATSAVLSWLHTNKDTVFQHASLNIRFAPSEGIMFIDVDTAKNLELVTNNLTGRSNNTLFGVLNHCHTPMGARLLRTSILQPSNIASEIEERLDAVQELLRQSLKIKSLRAKFDQLPKADLDTIIAQLSQGRHHLVDVATTAYRINLLLNLSSYLDGINAIRAELSESSARLLQRVETVGTWKANYRLIIRNWRIVNSKKYKFSLMNALKSNRLNQALNSASSL